MKRNSFHVGFLLLALLLYSCEAVLPLDDLSPEETEGITINALLNPDTTFSAYVTRGYLYTDRPLLLKSNGELITTTFLEEFYVPLDDSFSSLRKNLKASALSRSKVRVSVNNQEPFLMQYDTANICYQSDYTPQEGDYIKVEIEGENGQNTVATAEIPQAQRLEILSMERKEQPLHKELGRDVSLNNGSEYAGYVVKFKLRLSDPAAQKNYYRLKVRGIGIDMLPHINSRNVIDFYMSDDLIFRDERLTTGWGGWEACFSDVFDDRLFDGESYTFDIMAEAWVEPTSRDIPPDYIVELQSLSEDYYHYLKSMMLYRITASDYFSEGVYLHSNNVGGWGILGALHGEEHIMLWDKEKMDWVEK